MPWFAWFKILNPKLVPMVLPAPYVVACFHQCMSMWAAETLSSICFLTDIKEPSLICVRIHTHTGFMWPCDQAPWRKSKSLVKRLFNIYKFHFTVMFCLFYIVLRYKYKEACRSHCLTASEWHMQNKEEERWSFSHHDYAIIHLYRANDSHALCWL